MASTTHSSGLFGRPLAAALVTMLCLPGWPAWADAIDITEWSLETGILGGGYAFKFFNVVQNPFHDSHSALLGQSSAKGGYDFDWWDNNGTFLIQTSHQAHDTGGTYHLEVISQGWIKFTTSEDLAFSIDAAYSYYLPAYAMIASYGVTLTDVQSGQYYFSDGGSKDTYFGAPVSETWSAQGSGILPAGRQYRLQYAMYIDTFYGASNTTATGSGYVNFQLSPEPATAALVMIAAFAGCRRLTTWPPRTHRCGRSASAAGLSAPPRPA